MFHTSLLDESAFMIGAMSVIFVMLFIAAANTRRLLWALVAIYVSLTLMLVWFYRLPAIVVAKNEDVLFAPCDGVVKSITFDPASGRFKVIVFLNIFDQHHQFYPVSGHVMSTVHTYGSFHPAYILEKSMYNERQVTTIRSLQGENITITQIAGQIARRIVNNAVPGAPVEQGERMGMIKLSSRVDIEFSRAHFVPSVQPGMRIYAMTSAIAHRNK